MIKENEIIFKNPKIEEMINEYGKNSSLWESDDRNISGPFIRSLTRKQMAEQILAGYWTSLFECMMTSFEYTQWFDFTYETLKNLPQTLIRLYDWQKNTYSPEKNKEIIGKTIAAVLYGLAMNEQNCRLSVSELPMESQIGGPLDWAGGGNLSIRTGTKQKVDFRMAGLCTVTNTPIEVDGGAYISMTPAVEAYKMATGVDLAKYGVMDIIISAG